MFCDTGIPLTFYGGKICSVVKECSTAAKSVNSFTLAVVTRPFGMIHSTLNSTNDVTVLDTIHLVTWLSSLDIKVLVFLYVRLTGMYRVD